MNKELDLKIRLFGAWCGIYYILSLFIGWWVIAGYFPPHSPSSMPSTIAEFYSDNPIRVRFGLVLIMLGTGFFLPFTSIIADAISTFEGRNGPLTHTTLLAGFGNAVLTFYPPLWWLTAAFRQDRSVEIIYLLNDIAWLQFIGGIGLFLPIFLVIAFVAFKDTHKTPIFPRWFGYFSVWVFLLFLPEQLLFFFKSGPFAWNGFIGFWIPVSIFCAWFIAVFYLIRKSIKAQL